MLSGLGLKMFWTVRALENFPRARFCLNITFQKPVSSELNWNKLVLSEFCLVQSSPLYTPLDVTKLAKKSTRDFDYVCLMIKVRVQKLSRTNHPVCCVNNIFAVAVHDRRNSIGYALWVGQKRDTRFNYTNISFLSDKLQNTRKLIKYCLNNFICCAVDHS